MTTHHVHAAASCRSVAKDTIPDLKAVHSRELQLVVVPGCIHTVPRAMFKNQMVRRRLITAAVVCVDPVGGLVLKDDPGDFDIFRVHKVPRFAAAIYRHPFPGNRPQVHPL